MDPIFETDPSEPIAPQLTLGQRRVRVSFNPSANSVVDNIKTDAAAMIDNINQISQASTDGEVKRLCALAMTEIESAAMWAVKAATA